ncbi:MAG: HAMP domain-containing histidine kinase [Firmicutes bacterium]|nr:HAMP domain-containing histidine kinase [Bacillota bacterium]
MKSLKGHFFKTNILMVVLSAVLVVVMSFVLIFIVFIDNPDAFLRITGKVENVMTEHPEAQKYIRTFMIWAVVTVGLVTITCVALTANMAKEVLIPVNRLRDAAERIADGDLSFDVLTSEDAEELAALCGSMEKIRKRLKENAAKELEIAEERSMLVASLSHDLRTPVTTIKGYVEGIKDGIADTPEKKAQYLDTIYSKTVVLERLVDNMSEYSELELGRMQYVFEFMDITAFLKDISEEYEVEVGEAGFSFESQLSEQPMQIVGDRNKLKRVLDNLVSNAMKYNKAGGTITLSQTTDGKGVFILVSDTGTGIEKADLAKVFDGFYRGDKARSNIKGNGLGLAIAKQIVESHKGKIWVKSEIGIGTEFYIYIPLRDKE